MWNINLLNALWTVLKLFLSSVECKKSNFNHAKHILNSNGSNRVGEHWISLNFIQNVFNTDFPHSHKFCPQNTVLSMLNGRPKYWTSFSGCVVIFCWIMHSKHYFSDFIACSYREMCLYQLQSQLTSTITNWNVRSKIHW